MRFYLGFSLLLISCGTPQPKQPADVIGPKDSTAVIIQSETEPSTETLAPKDAVSANYRSGENTFYAYVKNVNVKEAITVIAFEDEAAPEIKLTQTYGAKLSKLRFQDFDRDLLLVNSTIKDTNFNKYYLYILKDDNWKLIVNGWAIHKYNKPDTLSPIIVDPEEPNKMKRFYSVFDLDKESPLGYTWRLLSERIPVENR